MNLPVNLCENWQKNNTEIQLDGLNLENYYCKYFSPFVRIQFRYLFSKKVE